MWQFQFRGCNLCASSKEDGTPSEWKTMKFLEVCLPPIAHPSTPPPFPDSVSFDREKKKEKVKSKVRSALVQFVRRSRALLEFTLGNTDRVVS